MKRHVENRISRIARRIKADTDAAVDQPVEPVEHDIDIHCFYDTDISQDEFSENFIAIGKLGSYGNHLLAYDFTPEDYDKDDIFEITDYNEYAEYFGSDYDYRCYIDDIDSGELAEKIISIVPLEELSSLFLEDFEGKNDFADWIEERSEEEESDGKYGWLLDTLPDEAVEAIKDEAKLMVDFPSFDDLWDAVSDDEGGIELKDGWSSFYTTGYNQGDYYTVFGKSELIDDQSVQDAIEHMLWDTPIYCKIEVDGEEYYVDSEMNDNYNYDKDEVIEIMKRLMGDKWDDQIEEYLDENLPDQPEYSY